MNEGQINDLVELIIDGFDYETNYNKHQIYKIVKEIVQSNPSTLNVPSDKKIGDAVVLNFGISGLLRNCFISAVKFTESQVRYDIKVFPFLEEEHNKEMFTLISDIPSYYIEAPEDRFTGKSNMPLNLES